MFFLFFCPCSLSLNDSSCCSSCTLLYIEVFCIPFAAWKLLTLGLLVYSNFSLKINLTCISIIHTMYIYICMYIYIYCIYLTCNNTASHRIDKGHFKWRKCNCMQKDDKWTNTFYKFFFFFLVTTMNSFAFDWWGVFCNSLCSCIWVYISIYTVFCFAFEFLYNCFIRSVVIYCNFLNWNEL